MTFKHNEQERVWFTSDLHFGHDQEFVWKARGFTCVEEMNETLIENFKEVVGENDHLYILGDLCLGSLEEARYWLSQLPGKITVIVGNHDTDNRIELYEELGFKVQYSGRLAYRGFRFFLSHYPTVTTTETKHFSLATFNLFGHTHQKERLGLHSTYSYNVGVDANDCYPVEIEEIITCLKHQMVSIKKEEYNLTNSKN